MYTFEEAVDYYISENLDEPDEMLHPAIVRWGKVWIAAIRTFRRPAELEHSLSQDSIATTSTMPLLTPASEVDALYFPASVVLDGADAVPVESSDKKAE